MGREGRTKWLALLAAALCIYSALAHSEHSADVPQCTLEMSSTLTFDACTTIGEVEVFYSFTDDDTIEFAFSKEMPDGGWLGLSVATNNNQMPDSYAVIAGTLASGGEFIDSYEFAPEVYRPPVLSTKQEIMDAEVSFRDGVLSGWFKRPRKVEGMPELYEGARINAFAGFNDVSPESREDISKHAVTPTVVNLHLTEGEAETEQTTEPGTRSHWEKVFISHGVLMAASWILIIPSGAIAVRALTKRTSIWFEAHRAVQVTALIIALAAWIMALVEGSRQHTAHLVIGCIVMSLAILASAAALFFRPKKDSSLRKGFNYGHRITAVVLVGLAVANTYIGIGILGRGKTVWYAVVSAVIGIMLALAAGVLLRFRHFSHGAGDDVVDDSKLESR